MTKKPRARYSIYLNYEKNEVLKKIMREKKEDNISSLIGSALVELDEYRMADKKKGVVGRPRKDEEEAQHDLYEPDYTDDLPKTITHYGRKIGAQEYEDIQEKSRQHNEQHKI